MSGTSVDAIDAVLADFGLPESRVLVSAQVPFQPQLRAELQALQCSGPDELHRAALAANALMDGCAEAVFAVLRATSLEPAAIAAIGLHGQTVRHRPDLGYTTQLANPARLAEAVGATIVADFRSRDVAAGGQGAPLAPAFHAALFGMADRHRAIVNIGGIANVTDLPLDGAVRGFDTGPGNTLLDAWCERNTGAAYDRDGAWAASGKIVEPLLEALSEEPYFALKPPKSTGRDRFNMAWLRRHLKSSYAAADVQRTLAVLSARTIAATISTYCTGATEVLICGGGAHNKTLMLELESVLSP